MAFEIFDDNAFLWFFQTLLSLTLVPYTIWRAVFKPLRNRLTSDYRCRCFQCLLKPVIREKRKFSFWVKLFALTAFWALYLKIFVVLFYNREKDFVRFDPYRILNLDENASPSKIKKRYYNLSLTYHPDKIKTSSPELAKKYVLIKKAYQTLQDDVARENYVKYGHPDGNQGMSITIGLPSFLTEKRNEHAILFVYFFSLVFFAIAVFLWWKKSSRFHHTGVRNESVSCFVQSVSKDISSSKFIEVIAMALEFRTLFPHDPKEFEQLFAFAKKNCSLSKPNYIPSINYTWTLLICHFSSHTLSDMAKKDYLFVLKHFEKILSSYLYFATHLDFWIQNLIVNNPKSDINSLLSRSDHRVPLAPVVSLLSFTQRFFQRLWFVENELKQVPHFGFSALKVCSKVKIYSLAQFLDLFSEEKTNSAENKDSNKVSKNHKIETKNSKKSKTALEKSRPAKNAENSTEKKGLNKRLKVTERIIAQSFNQKQLGDINCFLNSLPIVKMSSVLSSSSDAEKSVTVGDKIEIRLIVIRESLRAKFGAMDNDNDVIRKIQENDQNINHEIEGQNNEETEDEKTKEKTEKKKDLYQKSEKQQKMTNPLIKGGKIFAHCPRHPLDKEECLYLIVHSNQSVISFQKLVFEQGKVVVNVHTQASFEGSHCVEFLVLSDCYIGLEFRHKHKIAVSKVDEKEITDEEPIKELEESKEESLLSFSWMDIVVLAIIGILAVLIVPNTDFGKKYLAIFKSFVNRIRTLKLFRFIEGRD